MINRTSYENRRGVGRIVKKAVRAANVPGAFSANTTAPRPSGGISVSPWLVGDTGHDEEFNTIVNTLWNVDDWDEGYWS